MPGGKAPSVKIINLETGDMIEADPYVLREQCIPYGYRFVDEITVEEWIEALQKACGQRDRETLRKGGGQ